MIHQVTSNTGDDLPDGELYDYGLGGGDDDSDTESNDYRPSIVLMGLKRWDLLIDKVIDWRIFWLIDGLIDYRSGKTSIRKVVFQKMSPNETLFVESTARVTSESEF